MADATAGKPGTLRIQQIGNAYPSGAAFIIEYYHLANCLSMSRCRLAVRG